MQRRDIFPVLSFRAPASFPANSDSITDCERFSFEQEKGHFFCCVLPAKMQEIHGMGGGSELIGDDAGDGRMKQSQQNLNRQLLKCPRCDSINTKFCYYNNYNLSQPRHFCKSCRRYWTKGGVLRSVPVGGGCRKTKRSKPKNTSETLESVIIKRNSDSHSNSDCESSSPMAITVATAAETVSAPTLTPPPNLISAPEWYPFSAHMQNSPLQTAELLEKSSDGELFSYIGSFSEIFPIGCSNFSGVTPFHLSRQGPHRDQNDNQGRHNLWNPQSFIEIADEDEPGMPEIEAGLLDQTVEVDLPPWQRRPNMEFGSFNHLKIGRLDMIDIPGAIEGNYWNDPLGSLPPVNSQSNPPFSNN